MNNTPDAGSIPSGIFTADKISGFGYGIGISVTFLMVVTAVTLISYCCLRSENTRRATQQRHHLRRRPGEPFDDDDDDSGALEAGLDEVTLKSYPAITYSQARKTQGLGEAKTMGSCCSICLGDYRDTDMLRMLPECGHMFHLKCVDQWLRSHTSCPMCRSSPLQTPLAAAVPPPVAAARGTS